MPILAKKNEYVIPVTFKCNQHCSYCAIQNTYDYRDIVEHSEVLSKIKLVPDNSIVTLTGGEPGLLEYDALNEYIHCLVDKHCILYLETNGLFITRHYQLCRYFHEILYHCTIDIDLSEDIIFDKTLPLRYLLIVTDVNFSRLGNFLKKYNNIRFDIIAATYPYKDQITGPTLSNINRHKIIATYNKHMTKDSIKRMLVEKDFDSITWMFDKI